MANVAPNLKFRNGKPLPLPDDEIQRFLKARVPRSVRFWLMMFAAYDRMGLVCRNKKFVGIQGCHLAVQEFAAEFPAYFTPEAESDACGIVGPESRHDFTRS